MSRICQFCQSVEADKTGSHIFTSALISTCINQPGKNGRDLELMFGFGQDGSSDIFFGRDILQEKIEDVKGKELSDEEIEQNTNSIVYDHVFCTSCEKLFAVVESKFSPEIRQIRNGVISSFKENTIARVYFFIQILRASLVKYDDWSLESQLEDDLRRTILDCCRKIETNEEISANSVLFQIPILITYLETPTEDSSSNLIVIPNFRNPTVFFLCDFVLQIFENTSRKVSDKIEVYNLNDKRSSTDFLSNNSELPFYKLSDCDRKCLNENLVRLELAPQYVKSYQQKFIIACVKLGFLPTKHRIDLFTSEMFVSEYNIGKPISYENFKFALTRAIKLKF